MHENQILILINKINSGLCPHNTTLHHITSRHAILYYATSGNQGLCVVQYSTLSPAGCLSLMSQQRLMQPTTTNPPPYIHSCDPFEGVIQVLTK